MLKRLRTLNTQIAETETVKVEDVVVEVQAAPSVVLNVPSASKILVYVQSPPSIELNV